MSRPPNELINDIAAQFERLEQPCNLAWMEAKSVKLEEMSEVSQRIALILRGYAALHPVDQIAFVTQGVFVRRPPAPAIETVLGARAADAISNDNPKPNPDA